MKHLEQHMMARIVIAMTKLSNETLVTILDAGLAQIQQRVETDSNTWLRVKGKDIAQLRLGLSVAAADIERARKRFRYAAVEAERVATEKRIAAEKARRYEK